jgi:hypothetical protein
MINAFIFIGLFLFALWYSVIKYRRKQRAIRENGMVTMAVVTDAREAYEYYGSYDNSRVKKVYRHQLQYQAPDGTHTYHFKTRDSRLRLAVGQQVEIVYRADKPEVAIGSLALLMGGLSFFTSMSSRDFADRELQDWVETEGRFLDFHLADSGVRSSSDPGDHSHRWWVRFDYTLEYDVYGVKTTVTDTIERSGSRKYQSSIPENELEPPHYIGEETSLVFDPDDPGRYEIGSKESVVAGYRQNAEANTTAYGLRKRF